MSVLYRPFRTEISSPSTIGGEIQEPVTITTTHTVCKSVYTVVTIVFTNGRASVELTEVEMEAPEGEFVSNPDTLAGALEIVADPVMYLYNSGLPYDWTGIVSGGPVDYQRVCTEVEEVSVIGVNDRQTSTGTREGTIDTGWNAGARTRDVLPGDGRFSFRLSPDSLGIVCGLTRVTDSIDPFQILYPIKALRNTYNTPSTNGSFTINTVFVIQRVGTTLTWFVDDVQVDSTTCIPDHLIGRACLYSSGDAVFDAELGVIRADQINISGEATLPTLRSEGSIGQGSSSSTSLHALAVTGSGHDAITVQTRLPKLIVYGQQGGEYGKSRLPKLAFYGYSLPSPVAHGGAIHFSLSIRGYASVSISANDGAILPALLIRGSETAIQYGYNTLPTLFIQGSDTTIRYNNSLLPKLSIVGKLVTAEGSANLKIPDFQCRSVALNGLCRDPHRTTIVNGLKGTWLAEAEKRIETYYGIKGQGTRTLEVKLEYGNPYGDNVLEYVATTYQGGNALYHELGVEMLAFIPPNRLSFYSIDRVFAHELVHATMNDYVYQGLLPIWFHEGLAELIKGGAHRFADELKYTRSDQLMSAMEPWGGNSTAYAAAYVAIVYLHEHSTGIANIIGRIINGESLTSAIVAESDFAGLTAFVNAMQGATGRLFIEQLVSRGFGLSPDVGAIGGYLISNGPVLDDESVISDA